MEGNAVKLPKSKKPRLQRTSNGLSATFRFQIGFTNEFPEDESKYLDNFKVKKAGKAKEAPTGCNCYRKH